LDIWDYGDTSSSMLLQELAKQARLEKIDVKSWGSGQSQRVREGLSFITTEFLQAVRRQWLELSKAYAELVTKRVRS
jgi:hypothetical protein